MTDWWILEAVSKQMISAGKIGLPKGLAVCPVDGAPKVPNMVSILTAQRLNVLVLLDDEKQARAIRSEIVSARLIREQNVILISDALSSKEPVEVDIEDLIDAPVYETLARERR